MDMAMALGAFVDDSRELLAQMEDVLLCADAVAGRTVDPRTRERLGARPGRVDLAAKQQIVRRIVGQLKPHGWLFIGHSETLNGVTADLRAERPTVYRKV